MGDRGGGVDILHKLPLLRGGSFLGKLTRDKPAGYKAANIAGTPFQ
jgi:hypothetical protein